MTRTSIVMTAMVLLALPAYAAEQGQSRPNQQFRIGITQQMNGQELQQMSQQLRTKIESAIETARKDAGSQSQVLDASLVNTREGPQWSVQVVDPTEGRSTYYSIDAQSGQLLDRQQLEFRSSGSQSGSSHR